MATKWIPLVYQMSTMPWNPWKQRSLRLSSSLKPNKFSQECKFFYWLAILLKLLPLHLQQLQEIPYFISFPAFLILYMCVFYSYICVTAPLQCVTCALQCNGITTDNEAMKTKKMPLSFILQVFFKCEEMYCCTYLCCILQNCNVAIKSLFVLHSCESKNRLVSENGSRENMPKIKNWQNFSSFVLYFIENCNVAFFLSIP